jgi:superfamily II DNA or RNA helicase
MDSSLQGRETLPIVWAVPIDGSRRHQGRFWSFFPTQNETTLQGILNAPWKTNSDRENMLDGEFNRAMLNYAASMVADNIEKVNTEQDPGRFLDILPARDHRDWADRAVSDRVLELLRGRPCMPNARGVKQVPSSLSTRPELISEQGVREWLTANRNLEPSTLVHQSADENDRSARARRLGCGQVDVTQWLQSIVQRGGVAESIAAICLSDVLLGTERIGEGHVRRAEIVYTQAKLVVCPEKRRVAFAHEGFDIHPNVQVVHRDIASDTTARQILERRFGIERVSGEAVFRALLGQSKSKQMLILPEEQSESQYWAMFWRLSRGLSASRANEIMREEGIAWRPCVKACDGKWVPIMASFIPGFIIAEPIADTSKAVAIDMEYHSDDTPLLIAVGAADRPLPLKAFVHGHGHVHAIYRQLLAVPTFRSACAGRRPRVECLYFQRGTSFEPLDPIMSLTGADAFRLTADLITHAIAEPSWTMGHVNSGYPTVEMEGLLPWALRSIGWIESSQGPVRIRDAVGPALTTLSAFLPVAACSEQVAALLRLPQTGHDIGQAKLKAAVDAVGAYTGEIRCLTSFYACAAESDVGSPMTVRCRCKSGWKSCLPSEVRLTTDPGLLLALDRDELATLYSPDPHDVSILHEKWGMQLAEHCDMGHKAADEAVLAVDRFIGLRRQATFPCNLRIQQCHSLWVETRNTELGRVRQEIPHTFRESTLYYVGEQSNIWIVKRLCEHAGCCLSPDEMAGLASEADADAHAERVRQVRECDSIEGKLLAAIGEAGLRGGIPRRHLEWMQGQGVVAAVDVARLAHSVFGVDILQEYTEALSERGLNPPGRWAGGARAIGFVRDLGFPEEYAGFDSQGREPWEDVVGPVTLPALHGFQRSMCDEIRVFLATDRPSRGMLSLPTGAGKTRVAVEAAIEWIKMRKDAATVLWIAQSDELCEQCVQSWLQAWRAIGPECEMLRVNRLWGATNERVREPDTGSTLVVATFQSLGNRLERDDMSWVFAPSLVFIDEAHGAVAPSYTRILARLGLDLKDTARPLVGLTATPFRGVLDERETYRLAFRFEHRRFDLGLDAAPELYRQLQEDGVLAYADHEVLEGEEITLSDGELGQMKVFKTLPSSVESRLGSNEDRNRRILDHIRSQPEDWPILLFATSVEHAEDLAVRLSMSGISACAISADTGMGRRRHAIGAFKKGELRVLTNYGVLTTGFDAPAVRAIYVARPVYSRVLYQQMIGRGLRGPLNGGKPRCLFVNVADNVRQYGEQLAFHHFDHLWRKDDERAGAGG